MLIMTLIMTTTPAQAGDDERVPQFLKFPAIITNTFDGIHITGLVSISIEVHVENKSALRRLETSRPRLQDSFTRSVVNLAQLYIDPYRPLPWKEMMRALQHAADMTLPGEKMRVLVVDATTRPA